MRLLKSRKLKLRNIRGEKRKLESAVKDIIPNSRNSDVLIIKNEPLELEYLFR